MKHHTNDPTKQAEHITNQIEEDFTYENWLNNFYQIRKELCDKMETEQITIRKGLDGIFCFTCAVQAAREGQSIKEAIIMRALIAPLRCTKCGKEIKGN